MQARSGARPIRGVVMLLLEERDVEEGTDLREMIHWILRILK